MIKKTVGGERLGSGNKMKAALHNYERSTHDLGNAWRSSMAPGVLVPCYKKLCTNGDTWTINTAELVKTVPATGPCFGSYKMQIDFFEVPIRLYNGILHNNMTKIGMDMAKVKLPKVTYYHRFLNREKYVIPNEKNSQVATDSLTRYLGLKGLGWCEMKAEDDHVDIERKVNAVPLLAYYDIFKNYYANKQEEKAYVIDHNILEINVSNLKEAYYLYEGPNGKFAFEIGEQENIGGGNVYSNNIVPKKIQWPNGDYFNYWTGAQFCSHPLTIKFNGPISKDNLMLEFINENDPTATALLNLTTRDFDSFWNEDGSITLKANANTQTVITSETRTTIGKTILKAIRYLPQKQYDDEIKLQKFDLENIDNMRFYLLRETRLNTEVNINQYKTLPYSANWEMKGDGNSGCKNNMSGLVVKTYQSDMFNNWLSKEWIDGINGINAISAVNVESNKFTIDALNLAHKVYNMLNRIAISGGTYEDWQEAVYGEDAIRRAESPIYCGGASGFITFEEVVSTADTQTEAAGDQPLGSIAGKGVLTNVSGGNIEIHIKEPSYIIGIVSITPLIDYYLGNDFDITELDSLNDLHKPELDEIGFQDLMIERAAWWGKVFDAQLDEPQWINYAGGKLPAWIEYMTSVNEVYGDFADRTKLGWMVLTRDYEIGWGPRGNSVMLGQNDSNATVPVKDWTTYINPTAFNYQFADARLNAQNFWVQIGINATVRRKISAKLIPNL